MTTGTPGPAVGRDSVAARLPAPADWLLRQLRASWRREGEPAEPGFRLARPIVVLCGVATLLLLAVATVTILSLDTLWRFHEAAGFALLPVLAVKLAPIGVRAAAYYSSPIGRLLRRRPRTPGSITPPVLLARLSAPPLVAATALLLASGIVMWHTGDQRSTWSTVHNASAVVAGILVAVHLAAHARSTLALGARRLLAPGERTAGGGIPPVAVAGAIVAGILLAVFTVPNASWNPGRGDRYHGLPDQGAPPAVLTVPARHTAAPALLTASPAHSAPACTATIPGCA